MKSAKRIPNFTPSEKEVLMGIVLKHADVLEDEKTNRTTIEQKQRVWDQSTTEFNNIAPIVSYRNQDQLKRLYESKKKELRKKMAFYKNQQYKTGGGPPPEEPKLDKAEQVLIKIINEKTVYGFPVHFDSDAFESEPMDKISRKENGKNIDTSCPEQTDNLEDNIQVYEFCSENISTYDIIDIPYPDCVEKQSEKCPLFGLKEPMDKLKGQFSQSKISAESKSGIACPNAAGSSEGIELTPRSRVKSNESAINKNEPSLLMPSKTRSSNRRRPQGGIRALTSSDVAEKYNMLLDKRLTLIEKQIEQSVELKNFSKEEQTLKMKILKQQDDNLSLEQEEKKMKLNC